MRISTGCRIWISTLALLAASFTHAASDPLSFTDEPAWRGLEHPDWFKDSFLNLSEDLAEALLQGKRGIIVYFGQENCAYCQQFFENNLAQPDIKAYTQANFDVIPIDIFGANTVTTLDGDEFSEREFAIFEDTNFTPSLIFYDSVGNKAMRLRGYYPPYKFRAALEFVADGHHLDATFREYLARGEAGMHFEEGDLNPFELSMPPPYALARNHFKAERPLMVLFERGDCHACDILHSELLQNARILEKLEKLDVVRLDVRTDETVLTPDGKVLTAKKWADELGLIYSPAMVFFDEAGKEIIRIDSVVQYYRFSGVLSYVLQRGYEQEPTFQRWRFRQRRDRWKAEHGSDLL